MGFILKQVKIEDFSNRKDIYSKLVRGGLEFIVEDHILEEGKHIQLFFYRNHKRVKEFISKGLEKNYISTQGCQIELDNGLLRLHVNESNFMINTKGKIKINVKEYNFNSKELSLIDFAKGKVAILIDIYCEEGADNAKLKKELKDFNMEE